MFILGKMEEDIKESILMTKNMVMEYTHGQMEDNTMDRGKKESNMVREYIDNLMVAVEWVFGKTEGEYSG